MHVYVCLYAYMCKLLAFDSIFDFDYGSEPSASLLIFMHPGHGPIEKNRTEFRSLKKN